jgi:hypothetical protein
MTFDGDARLAGKFMASRKLTSAGAILVVVLLPGEEERDGDCARELVQLGRGEQSQRYLREELGDDLGDLRKVSSKLSVILSLSKNQFPSSEKRQPELILRQAQDDRIKRDL